MSAKDYFDDILSKPNNAPRAPENDNREQDFAPAPPGAAQNPAAGDHPVRQSGGGPAQGGLPAGQPGERSIRNISFTPRRAGRGIVRPNGMRDTSSGVTPPGLSAGPRSGIAKRKWVWLAAAASLLVLVFIVIFAFRSTRVVLTPTSRQVNLEQAKEFTAYTTAAAAEGNLTYSVVSNDYEDSAVVPSQGTENVSERASGNVTVYNEYSSSPVRIIKNSRFATPEGLVFRTPASIVIPGKKGNTPGSVSVTIYADSPGAEYNVGPVSRFTLPGLKGSDMYSKVYARSSAAMSGGFVGERPAVAPGALLSARAEVRSRLEAKAREGAKTLASESSVVFPDLLEISYSSLPETAEAGGGLRIREKAHVEVPVFPSLLLASAVYHAIDQNADNAAVALEGAESLAAKFVTLGSALGSSAIDFSLTGKATLVWAVDGSSLAVSLAGRDQNAFQDIIKGYPSIAEARATIQPFWKGSFPQDANKIKITVLNPAQADR